MALALVSRGGDRDALVAVFGHLPWPFDPIRGGPGGSWELVAGGRGAGTGELGPGGRIDIGDRGPGTGDRGPGTGDRLSRSTPPSSRRFCLRSAGIFCLDTTPTDRGPVRLGRGTRPMAGLLSLDITSARQIIRITIARALFGHFATPTKKPAHLAGFAIRRCPAMSYAHNAAEYAPPVRSPSRTPPGRIAAWRRKRPPPAALWHRPRTQ